jgi:hypothetical protein
MWRLDGFSARRQIHPGKTLPKSAAALLRNQFGSVSVDSCGIATSFLTAMINTRGLDCGTKYDALISIAPLL